MSQLQTLAMNVQAHAAQVGKSLGSDDDWEPTLFLESYRGQMGVVPISGAMLESVETKDALAQVLFGSIFAATAVRAAFLSTMWFARITPDRPQVLPSDDPNRVEVVWMVAADFEETLTWHARIRRRPGRSPALAPWKKLGEGLDVGGRFIEPLRAAMGFQRQVAEEPVAFMERFIAREDLPEEAREGMAALLEWGRSDPEAVEHMPMRQWWLGELARRQS